MRRLLILALPFLTACSSADGFRFERAQWHRSTMQLEVVTHPSLAELQAAGPKLPGEKLFAWGEITSLLCRIHIVDPAVQYMPEWIGHEVAHCFSGQWHPRQSASRAPTKQGK